MNNNQNSPGATTADSDRGGVRSIEADINGVNLSNITADDEAKPGETTICQFVSFNDSVLINSAETGHFAS